MHGYLADSKSFIYQTEHFSKNFSVFAPDFKGFGSNQGMEKPYSLSDYCDDVKTYIKENGLVKPHVIAHSFGGRVAVKLASENPELFDKIVLTGSAGLKPKRSVKYHVKHSAFKVLKLFVKKEKLNRFYSKDYLALSPVMKESFIKIVNEHLDDRLSLISNPTLIIFGNQDKETPVYMARKFNKKIKNSKLVIIKEAGHFAFIDRPEKFNWEVEGFLLR